MYITLPKYDINKCKEYYRKNNMAKMRKEGEICYGFNNGTRGDKCSVRKRQYIYFILLI